MGFTKSFTEHGYVIGIISARADLTYQRTVDRHWKRRTRYDYYYPSLAHLGEQALLNSEIYAQGTSADDEVFGYTERWSEMRFGNSKITGQFRSEYSEPLDAWHLSEQFQNLPTLSKQFIESNTPIDRVVAVPSYPDFIFDSYIKVRAVRPMPMFSVPGLIDHF